MGAPYKFRLYVAGMTPRCEAARDHVTKICKTHLSGQYLIEVIEVLEKPQLVQGDQILAIPTLVRQLPPPIRKISGDLSDPERVLGALDVRYSRP